MKEKIGLKIVDLIHDITQQEYTVSFSEESAGRVGMRFYKNGELVDYQRLGSPKCERIDLERSIIKYLSEFLEKLKNV